MGFDDCFKTQHHSRKTSLVRSYDTTPYSTYWLSQSLESSGLFKGSLEPGSALGEKRKKISVGEKKKMAGEVSREVVWGGERAAPFPSPQATARLASLADIFSI